MLKNAVFLSIMVCETYIYNYAFMLVFVIILNTKCWPIIVSLMDYKEKVVMCSWNFKYKFLSYVFGGVVRQCQNPKCYPTFMLSEIVCNNSYTFNYIWAFLSKVSVLLMDIHVQVILRFCVFFLSNFRMKRDVCK